MIYIYISNDRDKTFALLTRFEILPRYFRLLGKVLGLFIELLCKIHIASVSLCLLSASLCPINLFSFKFVLIVHICPAFYGNVNTTASESIQMFY